MIYFDMNDYDTFLFTFDQKLQDYIDYKLSSLLGKVVLDLLKFDSFLIEKYKYEDKKISMSDFLASEEFPQDTADFVKKLSGLGGYEND